MSRRIIVLLCSLALAIGLWLVVCGNKGATDTSVASTRSPDDNALDQNQKSEPEFHVQLPASSRLTLEQRELPEGGKVVLALPIASDSMDDAALPARVIAVDGRVIDLLATPAAGNQRQTTLALDPNWLTPGGYLIQLETKEKSALPVKRFVLYVVKESWTHRGLI